MPEPVRYSDALVPFHEFVFRLVKTGTICSRRAAFAVSPTMARSPVPAALGTTTQSEFPVASIREGCATISYRFPSSSKAGKSTFVAVVKPLPLS